VPFPDASAPIYGSFRATSLGALAFMACHFRMHVQLLMDADRLQNKEAS
jgi:hypothetical protein